MEKTFDSDTDWPYVEKPKYLPAAYALLLRAVDLGSLQANRGLGITQALLGDRDAAVAAWRQTKGIVPVLLIWGRQADHVGRFKDAIAWYDLAANIEKDNRDPWYYMGLAYAGQGNLKDALNSFTIGLGRTWGRETGVSDLWFQIGHTKRHRLKPPDFEGAWAAHSEAIKIDDFKRVHTKAEALYQMGTIMEQYGRLWNAAEFYQQALSIDSNHYAATVSLARVHWKMGKVERAVDLYHAAINIQPENTWAYIELARLYQETGKDDLARTVLCQIRNLNPDNVKGVTITGAAKNVRCHTK